MHPALCSVYYRTKTRKSTRREGKGGTMRMSDACKLKNGDVVTVREELAKVRYVEEIGTAVYIHITMVNNCSNHRIPSFEVRR